DDGRCCYAVKLGFGCPSLSLSLAPSSNKNCDFFQCPCVPCVGSVCVCVWAVCVCVCVCGCSAELSIAQTSPLISCPSPAVTAGVAVVRPPAHYLPWLVSGQEHLRLRSHLLTPQTRHTHT